MEPPRPESASVVPLRLELKHLFRIAHGTSSSRTNALVRLGELSGEAALPPYYPTTLTDISRYAASVEPHILSLPALQERLQALPPGPAPARAAFDMILHDAWGRDLGAPLYRLWGLSPEKAPPSSFTLPIPESIESCRATVRKHAHLPVLKLKLGSGDPEFDLAVVRTAREEYSGALGLDVNGGWTLEQAIASIPNLIKSDLLYVEEPIRPRDPDDWHLLRRMLPSGYPPLIADESLRTGEDLLELHGAVDGVNLKLTKCGGIAAVREMIVLARALDMQIMIGCMIESTLGLTAAAHLAPLADHVDLDGQLHVGNDPFLGMQFCDGLIQPPDAPGLGVTLKDGSESP